MPRPLQARCAATGHGDRGDAVRRQCTDGPPAWYPPQGQRRQGCSVSSPPGSRPCRYRGRQQPLLGACGYRPVITGTAARQHSGRHVQALC
jgi:hypothetical protein